MHVRVAVHIAARVMAAATDGEILVTDAVQEATATDARLEDRGRHRLKGVPGKRQLLAVRSEPTAR